MKLDNPQSRRRVLEYIRLTGDLEGAGEGLCTSRTLRRYRKTHPEFEKEVQEAKQMYNDSIPEADAELIAHVRRWKRREVVEGYITTYRTKEMRPVKNKDGNLELEIVSIKETQKISPPTARTLKEFDAWKNE